MTDNSAVLLGAAVFYAIWALIASRPDYRLFAVVLAFLAGCFAALAAGSVR